MEGMAFPKAQLLQLQEFIKVMKAKPDILHHPDLKFFKDYLESVGARIPLKPESKEPSPKPEAETPKEGSVEDDEPIDEPEDEESDVDLDMEGVIDPDKDAAQPMGDPSKELSDEDGDKFDEKRSEAMAAYSDGEFGKAVEIFTEAIQFNATSAMPFVKRGACYLKLAKPNACIRDCDRAIEINPDNAAAHKFRGRAHRLLGNFLDAAKDLRIACKIDFDEQADEWLREVTPNAQKIEKHERKKQMKKEEKELKEKKERAQMAREAQAKAAKEEAARGATGGGMPSGMGGRCDMADGSMDDLIGDHFFNQNPDLEKAISDPEVFAAFLDVNSNSANLMKYQNNPKVMKFFTKMAQKMSGGPNSVVDPELMEALTDLEVLAAYMDFTNDATNLRKYQNNPKVMKFFTKLEQIMPLYCGGSPEECMGHSH